MGFRDRKNRSTTSEPPTNKRCKDLSHFGNLSRAKRTITGSLSSATVLASALFLPSCSIVSIHNNVIFFTRLSFEFFIDTKIDVVKGTERRERLLARMFVDVLCNI